jgi:hypothetical protein
MPRFGVQVLFCGLLLIIAVMKKESQMILQKSALATGSVGTGLGAHRYSIINIYNCVSQQQLFQDMNVQNPFLTNPVQVCAVTV